MGDEARLSEAARVDLDAIQLRSDCAAAASAKVNYGRSAAPVQAMIEAYSHVDNDVGDLCAEVRSLRAALAAKDEETAALRADVTTMLDAVRAERVEAAQQVARLRAREERTAAVIEAARDAIDYIDSHIVEATGLVLARLEDLDHILTPARAALDALDATSEHARGVSEEDGSTAVLAASIALWERTDGCDPRWIRAAQEDGAEDALRAWRDAVQTMIERARPGQRSDAAEREGVGRGE